MKESKANKVGKRGIMKVCKHCHRVNPPKVRQCAECGITVSQMLEGGEGGHY